MYAPAMFGRGFASDLINDMFNWDKAPAFPSMTTDVKEYDDRYELELELPGFTKEEISAELNDGTLSITAEHKEEKENTDNGRFLSRERYRGILKRSFFVGRKVTVSDIKAAFTNGVLTLVVPKPSAPAVPEKQQIAIEG